tara:strand:- start:19396 stop:19521 length:126 start_codon:yes stop_codon:yes gene_type:complete
MSAVEPSYLYVLAIGCGFLFAWFVWQFSKLKKKNEELEKDV